MHVRRRPCACRRPRRRATAGGACHAARGAAAHAAKNGAQGNQHSSGGIEAGREEGEESRRLLPQCCVAGLAQALRVLALTLVLLVRVLRVLVLG